MLIRSILTTGTFIVPMIDRICSHNGALLIVKCLKIKWFIYFVSVTPSQMHHMHIWKGKKKYVFNKFNYILN